MALFFCASASSRGNNTVYAIGCLNSVYLKEAKKCNESGAPRFKTERLQNLQAKLELYFT